MMAAQSKSRERKYNVKVTVLEATLTVNESRSPVLTEKRGDVRVDAAVLPDRGGCQDL